MKQEGEVIIQEVSLDPPLKRYWGPVTTLLALLILGYAVLFPAPTKSPEQERPLAPAIVIPAAEADTGALRPVGPDDARIMSGSGPAEAAVETTTFQVVKTRQAPVLFPHSYDPIVVASFEEAQANQSRVRRVDEPPEAVSDGRIFQDQIEPVYRGGGASCSVK